MKPVFDSIEQTLISRLLQGSCRYPGCQVHYLDIRVTRLGLCLVWASE